MLNSSHPGKVKPLCKIYLTLGLTGVEICNNRCRHRGKDLVLDPKC